MGVYSRGMKTTDLAWYSESCEFNRESYKWMYENMKFISTVEQDTLVNMRNKIDISKHPSIVLFTIYKAALLTSKISIKLECLVSDDYKISTFIGGKIKKHDHFI